jgi:hypothetical protein
MSDAGTRSPTAAQRSRARTVQIAPFYEHRSAIRGREVTAPPNR